MRDEEFDVVAIAASSGGLHALSRVLGALPGDLPVAVIIVQHRGPDLRGLLAEILNRRTQLRVKEAEDGDQPLGGTVYLAPPGRHLLVAAGGVLSLSAGARVHHVRPSADLLFESVAKCLGPRVIAVVLTGGGLDGSGGVVRVRTEGGVVIAQDEATSEVFGMPRAAIATGCVDHILPLEGIAAAIVRLLSKRAVPSEDLAEPS